MYKRPNPASRLTIRNARPKLIERACMSLVFRILKNLQVGTLTISLPDGSKRIFAGSERSELAAHVDVVNYDLFRRVVQSGDVGFGESFTAGDWETDDLTTLIRLMIENRSALKLRGVLFRLLGGFVNRVRHLRRKNTLEGSRENIRAHYDLSNEMFKLFLDDTMTYSCAQYRSGKDSLEEAQRNKLSSIISKGQIEAGDQVLEIGCGWGSLALETVRQTGCSMTCVTLSEEQAELFRERVQEAGLEEKITIKLQDYRELTGQFDKILSVEMLEAVGREYIGDFFAACERLLKPNGLVVLQVITMPEQRIPEYERNCDWIQKHIFPGCFVPSLGLVTNEVAERSRLIVEHVENIGIHYARTLREWCNRFLSQKERVKRAGFAEEFVRAWKYYFCYCEAGFATRTLGTHQIVLTRPNNQDLKDTEIYTKAVS